MAGDEGAPPEEEPLQVPLHQPAHLPDQPHLNFNLFFSEMEDINRKRMFTFGHCPNYWRPKKVARIATHWLSLQQHFAAAAADCMCCPFTFSCQVAPVHCLVQGLRDFCRRASLVPSLCWHYIPVFSLLPVNFQWPMTFVQPLCNILVFILLFNFPIYFQFHWFFSYMTVWCVGCTTTGAIKPKVEQSTTATLFSPPLLSVPVPRQ